MNKIYFPGFGLELLISQTAFNIFGIDIRWYAVCIVFGIALALILCKRSSENFYVTFDIVLENTILALLTGIVGARLYYIIFNLSYYLENPIEMINIRDGGLAIYGGLITGGFTIYKLCNSEHINVLNYFDYIVPFVALAQSCGRWGNFFNIEAYGTETTSIFRMGIETVYGYMEVHPVFLYECLACLAIFVILRFVQKHRKFSGEIFYLYLVLYSGVRFFLEKLRQDSLLFLGFKVSRILSAIIFCISCIYLLKGLVKRKNSRKI